MPLVFFDVIKGRTEAELTEILNVSHQVFVDTLDIPEGDRYQILRQHEPFEMIIKDTGLGFERSNKVVVLTVVSRHRGKEMKTALYRKLVEELEEKCQIQPSDVMISFSINEDTDWSFGFGRAQFLTGELKG
ncbi:tautomerase family protein [Vagococcus fluvialis]|uniref:Tautomerase family protein n=1 Tax=Vagococcus fluvialis TaxID=2738 RepID=A0A7X6I214_9ENTE|nr:tautomerase family protein [uncultured Vagococcus sp.]NKC66971.1 tautomerase family protein [Vagococcus fluvialis]